MIVNSTGRRRSFDGNASKKSGSLISPGALTEPPIINTASAPLLPSPQEKEPAKPFFPPPRLALQDESGGDVSVGALPLGARVWLVFHDPSCSRIAYIWFVVMMVVVVVSVCAFVTGTMPENTFVESDSSRCPDGPSILANCLSCFEGVDGPKVVMSHYCAACEAPGSKVQVCAPSAKPVYRYIERYCIYFFTADYVAKLLTVGFARSALWRPGSDYGFPARTFMYMAQPLNVVDMLATAPYWVELLFGSGVQLGFVRVLRLARVLRILKLGKNSSGVQMISNTISRSMPALGMLSFYIVVGVVLFGSVIYMAEGGTYIYDANVCPEIASHRCYARPNNYLLGKLEPSPFYSIPMSFYW